MKNFDQNKVRVFLNLEGVKTELGTLVHDEKTIYFHYYPKVATPQL